MILSDVCKTPIPSGGAGREECEPQPHEIVTSATCSDGHLRLHFNSKGHPSIFLFQIAPEYRTPVMNILKDMKGKPYQGVMAMVLPTIQ
jgi:hypothetical protein